MATLKEAEGNTILEIRQKYEYRDKELPPDSQAAATGTVECAFCSSCSETVLSGTRPNCSGNFTKRPIGQKTLLEKHPPSAKRVIKDDSCFHPAT